MKPRAPRTMRGGLRTLLASLVALLVVYRVIDEGLIGRSVFVVLSLSSLHCLGTALEREAAACAVEA